MRPATGISCVPWTAAPDDAADVDNQVAMFGREESKPGLEGFQIVDDEDGTSSVVACGVEVARVARDVEEVWFRV